MTSSSRVGIPVVGRLLERLNLRFPTLFVLLSALTLVDFLVPDAVPLVDEVGLLLLTMLVGRWKGRRSPHPNHEAVPGDR